MTDRGSPRGMAHSPPPQLRRLISQKRCWSQALKRIHTVFHYEIHAVTLPGGPTGTSFTPLLHKRPYVAETVQLPNPKAYIFLFFMMRRIQ